MVAPKKKARVKKKEGNMKKSVTSLFMTLPKCHINTVFKKKKRKKSSRAEFPIYKKQLVLAGFGNKKVNRLLRPTKPVVDDDVDGYI